MKKIAAIVGLTFAAGMVLTTAFAFSFLPLPEQMATSFPE